MIQTNPTMRILVATQPVDFRRGIDGLAAICRNRLQQDPLEYLTVTLKNAAQVKENPARWLPWNYREQLDPR